MSEMSGDTTSATPRRPSLCSASTTAGAWKQSDLPPPVGRTTTLSRPSRTACIASRWSGLNVENPQTRWRASLSSESGWLPDSLRVLGADIRIDEALEFDGQLVVVAAQRSHVLAVDEDRAVRRFARARQAD